MSNKNMNPIFSLKNFRSFGEDVLISLYDEPDAEYLYLNHISEIYLILKEFDNALKNMYSLRNCVIKNFDDESLKAYCLYQIDDIINETKQNKNRADSGQATTPHSLGEE